MKNVLGNIIQRGKKRCLRIKLYKKKLAFFLDLSILLFSPFLFPSFLFANQYFQPQFPPSWPFRDCVPPSGSGQEGFSSFSFLEEKNGKRILWKRGEGMGIVSLSETNNNWRAVWKEVDEKASGGFHYTGLAINIKTRSWQFLVRGAGGKKHASVGRSYP